MNKSKRTNFDNVLKMVREEPEIVFGRYSRMLSDLSAEKTSMLREALAGLTVEKRKAFYLGMYETCMEYYEYNYAPIAEIGVSDADGDVRTASIQILGLEDSRKIGALMLDAARNDPFEKAQIAAIQVLGQYMFESALDNRIPVNKDELQKTLSSLIESKNAAVRRAAVVSYAVSEDKRVKEIISGYLAGNDRDELVAALAAVRHSIGEEWADSVLELMRHDDDDVSMEAIRTAGTLRLREALPALYEILSRFDRITPDLLLTATEAVAEIGDESSLDVLETLGEAVVDMDAEITDAVDDAIDTLNMTIHMGYSFDDEPETKKSKRKKELLDDAIENAKDRCLTVLEEKIPHDLEDDQPFDLEEDEEDDACGCGEHHSHHDHEHHHHHHENPLEGMDLSRFRILDDLESYEKNAAHDADEEDLWAEFEDMAEEDLDAESLQDFINKLESRKKK